MVLLLAAVLALGGPEAGQAGETRKAEPTPAAKSNAALVREAREAHGRGDKAAFLSIYEDLARRRPGEVFTLYNLACGQAVNGQGDAAIRTLEDILAHRVSFNLEGDTDFDSIRQA